MIARIKRFFGLPGSWSWACRQMERGNIVRPGHATGAVKYKLDDEGQRRIVWDFRHGPAFDWKSANIFLSDFESTDWEIWKLSKGGNGRE